MTSKGLWGREGPYPWHKKCPQVTEESYVKSLIRRFAVPASESQLALTLTVSLVMMAALLLCLLWQGSIIKFQQELIRELWAGRYRG